MSSTYDRIISNDPSEALREFGSWRVDCIDMHTAGEPLRVIIRGMPELEARTVLGARREMQERHDHVRSRLMWEPRGHADMYGALLLPPERPESDFGVLFMHNEGYSTMCGHATLALAKLAATLGWVTPSESATKITIDAPCGQLLAEVRTDGRQATGASYLNVPSFVADLGASATLGDGRSFEYDLAYGGAFYAFVDAKAFGLSLTPEEFPEIVKLGRAIKHVVQSSNPPSHPFEPDLGFLYGTIFVGDARDPANHSRNVCVFADGEVDRSPTGSGVSGRAAIHHARGELQPNTPVTIESIIGSTMRAEIADTGAYGPHTSVTPRVSGDAWITGMSTHMLDSKDQLGDGFMLR